MRHKRGIGGTDLAAVCAYYLPNVGPEWTKYCTAADVWMRLVHDVERPRTAIMQRGIDAEPRLRKVYLDVYGGAMMPKPKPWVVPHPRLPFVSVSPDDVWIRDFDFRCYVEIKSTNIFALYPPPGRPPSKWGPAESDVVPESYGLQVQLGLEILDMDVAHLFAGFGRDTKENGEPAFLYEETRRYVIHRDRELMAMALGFAERFHEEHIRTRQPPSVEPRDNKRAWKRLLKGETWKPTETTEAS